MSVSSLITPALPAGSGCTPYPVPQRATPADEAPADRLMVAIEAVYRERFGTFHRVATSITGDRELGWDAVQEAFSRAIRRRMDFRGDGPLEGWLWRTVINAARDHRRVARSTVLTDEPVEAVEHTAGESTEHAAELLRWRIARLPERQRTTLFLRYYADMSYQEIAVALDIRTGTVSATLNAAHQALRCSLAEISDDRLPVGSAGHGAVAGIHRRVRRQEAGAGARSFVRRPGAGH